MNISLQIIPKSLEFKIPAKTSRGAYCQRKLWHIYVRSEQYPNRVGIGELAPLPNLSKELDENFLSNIERICSSIRSKEDICWDTIRSYPSLIFALETALKHLEVGTFKIFNTPFSRGEEGLLINGLIWMGDREYMLDQIKEKISQGFRCIKIKIGALDFEEEYSLLKYIRREFSQENIELRVDANGAFSLKDVLFKLDKLSRLDIHSIEQPIASNQIENLAKIVRESPLPIALDEELIDHISQKDKIDLLDFVAPHFLVIKPSLHGGIFGSEEWLDLARQRNIGWWITSALESNIGLNSIAQWCASLKVDIPQGLGTGQLFVENFTPELEVKASKLWYK